MISSHTYYFVLLPLWLLIGFILIAFFWNAFKDMKYIEALILRALVISACFPFVPLLIDSQDYGDFVWTPIWFLNFQYRDNFGFYTYLISLVYILILTPFVSWLIYVVSLLKKFAVMKWAIWKR